ncbi:MAG: DNA topoisomerase I [Rhodospirillaceae bacterium]|nr:DNA topoisomerase I [Rhodospirillaceae bacterium]|tara:strand:- start:24702 stop:27299 length:2598 start_codon:yes stop_codon:yes gene_type:complete
MNVVVVESPAKAKTINKYLGSDFTVLASYGHVRDLPPKNGSVDPDQDFNMLWQVGDDSEKHLKAIIDAAQGADHLYLATDPDREGEAISWHVQEVLESRNALDGVNVKRIVFHEITKDAVLQALKEPRGLDHGLIEAYLARRALDYLVGFTLSPVLWRKLPGSRSAGRVQSVALRLISERESEIEKFVPQEYWSIEADFTTRQGGVMTSRMTHLDGEKLDRFSLANAAAAERGADAVKSGDFRVTSIERKSVFRNPQPPFTTSTLQQEASRKLGFGTARTMRIAQRLYEGVDIGGETVGLITYMRTDSNQMAQEAITASRNLIRQQFGAEYVPDTPNVFRNRSKNAQEAHEAVRPTDFSRLPKEMSSYLDDDGRRLYELIWKRAMASSMQKAALEQVAIDSSTADRRTVLRSTGSVIVFDGFLTLYQEDRDDPSDDDDGSQKILPRVTEGEPLTTGEVRPEQHFTKPPPRFTEASLVRKMEELGIGRPSTYASIISVLQDRNYVRLENKRFEPENRGRVVTAFLSGYFERYVEYNFTADLEDRLDRIASGDTNWKQVLRDFWDAFYEAVKGTENLKISDVIDTLDADLGPHFFPPREDGSDTRVCPSCDDGRLGLKLGKGGPFIGCSNYPECNYTRPLSVASAEDDEIAGMSLPKLLGIDPETAKDVTLRKGPFGFYIQLGEPEGKQKPKRATLLKNFSPTEVTLEIALALLALPRDIGPHPESGEMIQAGIGRYGPYLKMGPGYTSLGPDEDVLSIGLNRAVTIIKEKPAKRRGAATALRDLGAHPDDGKPVGVFKGRYGPYVKHGSVNASIPKSETEESISLEQAVELLAARAAKGKKGKKKAKKKAKKKSSRKKAAKAKADS